MKDISKFLSKIFEKNNIKNHSFIDKNKLINIGFLLKERRERFRITRETLSLKTKISINVIKSLEDGETDDLPEKAYLVPILKSIENELGLDKNFLKEFIDSNKTNYSKSDKNYFSPSFIDIFSGWKGKLIYFIFITLCILALNKYNEKLIRMGTKSFQDLIHIDQKSN